MSNLYEKLNKETAMLRLSADEKRAMRATVFGLPVQAVPLSRAAATRSPYLFASHKWMTALATLLMLVSAGGGTAFAAQGALPGDVLYPIKIRVNESVEVALATTPAEKAKIEVHIAERRVAEAQTLAAQGRLDATTTQEIEENFESHASRALALAGGEQPTAILAAKMAEPEPELQTQEDQVPRATATLMITTSLAPEVPEATSSQRAHGKEAAPTQEIASASEASSTQAQKGSQVEQEGEAIHTSIEKQRGILNEIKLKVGERARAEGSNIEHDEGQGR